MITVAVSRKCANPDCGHSQLSHDYGRRRGAKVHTKCLVWDEKGQCPCKLFELAKVEEDDDG